MDQRIVVLNGQIIPDGDDGVEAIDLDQPAVAYDFENTGKGRERGETVEVGQHFVAMDPQARAHGSE